VNRRRGLTLRTLRRHPRRRAGVAPDTAAGAALLQISRASLLPYLETLQGRERISISVHDVTINSCRLSRERKRERERERRRKAPYREDALLQGLFGEALSPGRRIIAPGFQDESSSAVVHSTVPPVGGLRRRGDCWSSIGAPQRCQGRSHLLRWFVMTRQTERRARSHPVSVPHAAKPLALISTCNALSM